MIIIIIDCPHGFLVKCGNTVPRPIEFKTSIYRNRDVILPFENMGRVHQQIGGELRGCLSKVKLRHDLGKLEVLILCYSTNRENMRTINNNDQYLCSLNVILKRTHLVTIAIK